MQLPSSLLHMDYPVWKILLIEPLIAEPKEPKEPKVGRRAAGNHAWAGGIFCIHSTDD